MVFIAFLLFGYKRCKINNIKRNVTILVFIVTTIYFIGIYGIGILTGYKTTNFEYSIKGVFDSSFGIIVYIACAEFLRYIFISGNRDKKYLIVLFTIVATLIEINLTLDFSNIGGIVSIFNLITKAILPAFAKNLLLSYLSYNLGVVPPLIYNIIMSIYMFVVPVFPNLNDYVVSLLGILLPYAIYIFASRMISEYYDEATPEFNHRVFNVVDIVIGFIVLVLVIFISGYFRFQLIGIASGSMYPSIKKGDAVMVDKKQKIEDLKVGDIIAYRKDDRIIIHRIVSKEMNQDGIIAVDTKGDANNTNDNVEVTDNELVGKITFTIPYLAWPTVWLTERIG
jgi:signal peptidase I